MRKLKIMFKKKKYIKELEVALTYVLASSHYNSAGVVYDVYYDSSYELIRTYNEEWDSVYFEARLKSLVEKKKDKKRQTRRQNKREKARLNRKIKRANYTEIIKNLEIGLDQIIIVCQEIELSDEESLIPHIEDIASNALRRV